MTEAEAEVARKRQLMEARASGESALIFSNLLNGVAIADVARTYKKGSEAEVGRIFQFVLNKIKSYCFERGLPPMLGSGIPEIGKNQQKKLRCFEILPMLNLDKDPKFAKILDEKMELRSNGTLTHQDVLKEMHA